MKIVENQEYLDTAEVMKTLAASKKLFYANIKPQLHTYCFDGKKKPWYRRADILAIAGGQTVYDASTRVQPQPVGMTDWVRQEDLPAIVKLDLARYGELTVPYEITQHWWRKNPTACRVLFNAEDRTDIWGALSVIPLPLQIIMRILRGDMEERDITADDVFTYEEAGEYNVYIPSALVREDHRSSLPRLIHSVLDFWCEQYPHIRLGKVYAFTSSDDGMRLARYLYFDHRPDIGENVFVLDPYSPNPARLLKQFQECIKEREE